MKRLLEKYKKNTLSLKELQILRDQTQELKDEELEKMFLDDWVNFEKDMQRRILLF